MKLVIIFLFVVSALADRLQNNYLPPITSRTAGGAEFLTAPSRISNSNAGFRSSRLPVSAQFNSFGSPQFGRTFNGVPIERQAATFRNSETFSTGPQIPILRLTNDNNGEGSYRFAYETDNKITHEEEGHQESFGAEQGTVVRGSYSYQSPEGQTFTVNYIADENGFQATGNHLPTSPPIPEAIQRSLSLNLGKQRLVDNSGAYSGSAIDSNKIYNENSEAHDLDSVEVGRPVNNGVNRQYLAPFRSTNGNGGYRY